MNMPAGLKAALASFIEKTLIGMTGLKGWIAAKAMQYGGQVLYDFAMNLWNKIVRGFKQKEAKKEYDKVVADPNSTVDERGKAYERDINAGRD